MDEKTNSDIQNKCSLPALPIPYLLGLWCCLAILQGSPGDIPPVSVLLKTAGLVLLAIGALHLCLFFLVRKSPTRELLLCSVVGFTGIFGHLSGAFSDMVAAPIFLVIWTGGFAALGFMILKSGQGKLAKDFTPIGLIGLSFSFGVQLFNVAIPVISDRQQIAEFVQQAEQEDPLRNAVPPSVQNPTALRPDIYYLIVDAYARQDVLRDVYGFDNSEFIDQLRDRGFFVGDKSRSNYHLTELSLASSLNLTHLPKFDLAKRFQTRLPVRALISDTVVSRFLKKAGYKTIAFETGKSDTECKSFDEYRPYGFAFDEYQDVLYHTSVFPYVAKLGGDRFPSPAAQHGKRIEWTMDQIASENLRQHGQKPIFVFSHMLCPHPPFVFDQDGNRVDKHGHYLIADGTGYTEFGNNSPESYRDAYCDQLAFLNKKLIQAIDTILESERPTIIILQADHGPRLGVDSNHGDDMHSDSWFREGFAILNAIHVPVGCNPAFYSSATPVNTFRLIFNELFDSRLELEPDTSFIEMNYKFADFTDSASQSGKQNLGRNHDSLSRAD